MTIITVVIVVIGIFVLIVAYKRWSKVEIKGPIDTSLKTGSIGQQEEASPPFEFPHSSGIDDDDYYRRLGKERYDDETAYGANPRDV